MAIFIISSIWLPYSYAGYLLSEVFHPGNTVQANYLHLRWVPGVALILFFQASPTTLLLKTIRSLIGYILAGLTIYCFHLWVVGPSIIDASWYIGYYISIGALIFLRRTQRESMKIANTLREEAPFGVIRELKNDWQLLLTRFVQVYLAVGTVVGVCMTILLTAHKRDLAGFTIEAWRDWGNMVNALKMTFLFVMMSITYFIFFLAPILELVGSFQESFLRFRHSESRSGSNRK